MHELNEEEYAQAVDRGLIFHSEAEAKRVEKKIKRDMKVAERELDKQIDELVVFMMEKYDEERLAAMSEEDRAIEMKARERAALPENKYYSEIAFEMMQRYEYFRNMERRQQVLKRKQIESQLTMQPV